MKFLNFAVFSVILVATPIQCFAQKKQTQTKWFSVTTYDSGTMMVEDKEVIKDVNEFLKFACSEADPIFSKEIKEQAIQGYSDFFVELIDGNTDANGRVLTTTLTLTHLRTTIAPIRYKVKIFEEKFFRERKECMKESANFKLWLIEKNKEYRSSIERYK